MKALLMKDFYVLWKQMRIFLLIILIFSAIPSSFNNLFAVVYAAMLPYTAGAYDERSKWDQLAAMMPYADRDVVLSKYVLGWLATAAAAVISLLLQGVISLFWQPTSGGYSPVLILLAGCAAVGIVAIMLPPLFRFGVEKGRVVMFLFIFLVCGSAGALSSIAIISTSYGGTRLPAWLIPAMAAAALVLNAVSIPLSLRFYRRRGR